VNAQQQFSPAPVRRSVRVKATPERAFEVFARQMGKWWPKGHSIGTSPLMDVIIEPRLGGRFYERGEDGSEYLWGRVIEYHPGKQLLLAWQLNAEWKFDPDFEVELEIRFTPDGEYTVVELEHRHLERFGARAHEIAASLGGKDGWPGILVSYVEAVNAAA